MENREKVGKGNPPMHSRFKPGVVTNPNGRPRKIPALDKLLADVLGAEKDGKTEAEAILAALLKKAKGGDVRAADVLLSRAYGKPKEFVETINTNIDANDKKLSAKKIALIKEKLRNEY